jgi:hypothetical protein
VSRVTLQDGRLDFSHPRPFYFENESTGLDGEWVATALVMDCGGTAILQPDHHSDPPSMSWFKLALLHADEQPREEPAKTMFKEASKAWAHMAAKDMISIFLRALLRPPLESWQRAVPLAHRAQLQFHLTFTFPASWGHDDRKRMKVAVEAIDVQALVPGSSVSILYVSEQEAAFLSLLEHPIANKFQVRLPRPVCAAQRTRG